MKSPSKLVTNFSHLGVHHEQLLKLGMLAEKYFPEDPNTAILKLRQLGEALAQWTASLVGLPDVPMEGQYERLGRLRSHGILPMEIHQLFDQLRRTGNEANHELFGNHATALTMLKIAWQASVWFHRTFRQANFRSGPFIPPAAPANENDELRRELERLTRIVRESETQLKTTSELVESIEAKLRAAQDESTFWAEMAQAVDDERASLSRELHALAGQNLNLPAAKAQSMVKAAGLAAGKLDLDEAGTRQLIDAQLRLAGWTVDSVNLTHAKGARPQKGLNQAIAEWPTANGPADYVLFAGLLPLATVEAKRANKNVSSAIQQAKRYCRGFQPAGDMELHERNWGANHEFRLPFAFSTNGRPWLRQLTTHSGIWFCDLRHPENQSAALQGWYSPEGLVALLKQNAPDAHDKLAEEGFDYGFSVREYQRLAILEAEKAIGQGKREMLIAMATGTGKTKTCIALIYRLLKTQRFRRILFLVDRSALGEQAANAFKDTRMESLQSFADVFGIKELDAQTPDSDTSVHIATIQGMVARVLNPGEHSTPPPVDAYDCIIVDECHRGYLLDREMSEAELTFRSYEDYISQYRRVLDYFHAVKIGLTATPALHTYEIFHDPVFVYSYREAVIDGYLVDHEPPFKILTELSSEGIVWKKGEDVHVYNPATSQIDLFKAPDELKFDVEEFNRKVISQEFNRVVCEELAKEIDPSSSQKTLVFCVDDKHADLVVLLLKQAFAQRYGAVDDDAVVKITGAADKPLQLIRRYKNERYPSVAVTVDLLTTGVDVPKICNLVFLRRVNSRILFDQMLGRATRLCEEIGKESFRIFDAVRLYEALEKITAMKPVVVNPSIPFAQLARELSQELTPDAAHQVRDQFIAKLQRKKRHLKDEAARDFESAAGMTPDAFLTHLATMPLAEVADWFTAHPGLGELLDRKTGGDGYPVLISEHKDQVVEVTRGFGKSGKPADYLAEFKRFLLEKKNDIPALLTVLTRPRDLTRQDLKKLLWELDQAGFTEASLATAYRDLTNQEIAARIVGYIRQAALGDPLMSYEQRVDKALQSLLATRAWSTPQRQWLQRLAAQTKANLVVDRAALDDPDQIFKREGGGFNRLNKVFDGQLADLLGQFHDALWTDTA